jgi:hypothetical protein
VGGGQLDHIGAWPIKFNRIQNTTNLLGELKYAQMSRGVCKGKYPFIAFPIKNVLKHGNV